MFDQNCPCVQERARNQNSVYVVLAIYRPIVAYICEVYTLYDSRITSSMLETRRLLLVEHSALLTRLFIVICVGDVFKAYNFDNYKLR